MRIPASLLAAFFLIACATSAPPAAQPAPAPSPSPRVAQALRAAEAHIAAHEPQIVEELRAFLALPNVASEPADIRANAEALVAMLARRGAAARILETPGAPVSVFGEIATPGAARTLLFYAHFDGQPAGPLEAWATPPFEPVLRAGRAEAGAPIIPWPQARFPLDADARIYARSASDDKSPIIAMLAAIDALRAAESPLSANIKFFFEGEEEAGSPNLTRTLALHRDALAADVWIFADGPIDPRGLPRVALGVRGVSSFRITVFGPATGVHSGHYGNVAPNPGARLAHLIASMRAPDGRITIDGFEEASDPPSPAARALAAEAFDDSGMLAGPMIAAAESSESYGEAILRPALNVTQLSYGGAGAQRNAIDPEASAGFDLRLTPGLSIEEARTLIADHLRAQGYVLVDAAPTEAQRRAHPRLARLQWNELGYESASASLSNPRVAEIVAIMRAATADEVRIAPLLGGSLPIAPIGDVLGAPFVIVPMVNADNNQHAANENLRIGNLRAGIAWYAALMAAYAAE